MLPRVLDVMYYISFSFPLSENLAGTTLSQSVSFAICNALFIVALPVEVPVVRRAIFCWSDRVCTTAVQRSYKVDGVVRECA